MPLRFLLLSFTFRNRDFFKGLRRKKVEKMSPRSPFASGLHFPPSTRCLSPQSTALSPGYDPAQTLSSISLFRKSNRALIALAVGRSPCRRADASPSRPPRRGHPRECSHPSVRYSSLSLSLGAATTGVSNAWIAGSGGDGGEGPSSKIWTDLYQEAMIGTDHRLAAEARARARAARAELSATSRARIEWVLVAIVASK